MNENLTKKEVELMIQKALNDFMKKQFGYKSRITHDRPSDPNTLGSFNWQLPVTGSKGGNAALTSLLTQLAGIGLINNSTT